jgi:hypothetical protein
LYAEDLARRQQEQEQQAPIYRSSGLDQWMSVERSDPEFDADKRRFRMEMEENRSAAKEFQWQMFHRLEQAMKRYEMVNKNCLNEIIKLNDCWRTPSTSNFGGIRQRRT